MDRSSTTILQFRLFADVETPWKKSDGMIGYLGRYVRVLMGLVQ